MAIVSTTIKLQSDIHNVWEMVTSIEKYAWRSDLSETKRLNNGQFIEYTKAGYATTFTTTRQDPYERWEFDMENDHMKGHWTGIFKSKESQTEIILTENVSAKKFYMKPLVKALDAADYSE